MALRCHRILSEADAVGPKFGCGSIWPKTSSGVPPGDVRSLGRFEHKSRLGLLSRLSAVRTVRTFWL